MAVWNTSLSPIQLPNYTYPQWSVALGWFIRMTSVLSVPAYIVYLLLSSSGTLIQVSVCLR